MKKLFVSLLVLGSSALFGAVSLQCTSNYRTAGDKMECGSSLPAQGPIQMSKTFDKLILELEGKDERYSVSVTSETQNLSTKPKAATVRVIPAGQVAPLANSNVSVSAEGGGGRLLLNLGEVSVSHPKPNCKYYRYLSIRCEAN